MLRGFRNNYYESYFLLCTIETNAKELLEAVAKLFEGCCTFVRKVTTRPQLLLAARELTTR